jgi:hypothetical protein
MTEHEINEHIKLINSMDHKQMAKLWRNAPSGHLYFDSSLPFFDVFEKRFKDLGGMTVDISKEIGW